MTPGKPSRTAEAVCLMRALDQARPAADRVVDDPFAAWFLSQPARAHLALVHAGGKLSGYYGSILPGLTSYIQYRHRYMDDCLLNALSGDGPAVEQVVVLGAGYDMRAYRFADKLGGRPVYEVDYPATQARKVRLLAPHQAELPAAEVHRVGIDFQSQALEDVLSDAGFAPGRPTFFFWEGVSMYLRRDAVKATLATLHALGGEGSGVVMDFWHLLDSPDLVATAHRMSPGFLHLLAEPVTFALHPEDAPDFLRRLGWQSREVMEGADLVRRYPRPGRSPYPGTYCVWATR